MCGRFANNETIPAMAARFHARSTIAEDEWKPTYNVAPTHLMPAIIQDEGGRRLGLMRWGWPQSWNPAGLHVNAIGETAWAKGSFKDAFANRRCIVPATEFFEWRPAPGKGKPMPYAFRLKQGGLFGIAGLWQMIEHEGKRVGAFILLTTNANPVVKPVHHRMAAMLPPSSEDLWLDPKATVEQVRELLAAYDAEAMETFRVSDRVNKVSNNDPTLLDRMLDEPEAPDAPP